MEKIVPYLIIGAVALVILIILIKNICIVQQSRAYVIERLGAFSQVWEVGIHFKLPFVERIARRVSLKEQVLDYPPQPVITKDNVTMQIDTVVYFQITDPKLYTYGVEQPMVVNYGNSSQQRGDDGYGCRFCQCWDSESDTGGGRYHGR